MTINQLWWEINPLLRRLMNKEAFKSPDKEKVLIIGISFDLIELITKCVKELENNE